MFGMGMGELLVLAVVGLFVLGPERLPAAIRWVSGAVGHAKDYLETAKEQMNSPEFDDIRRPLAELREPLAELRAADPRRALRRHLLDPPPAPSRPTPNHTDRPSDTADRDDHHDDTQGASPPAPTQVHTGPVEYGPTQPDPDPGPDPGPRPAASSASPRQ